MFSDMVMKKLLLISLFGLSLNYAHCALDGIVIPGVNWLNPHIKQVPNDNPSKIEKIIHKIEKKYEIPHGLLAAIAFTESGKSDQVLKKLVIWPWTVNANGKSYYLQNKAEAIRKVRELKSMGINMIDVGCMQINLVHHPKAFRSLDEAFSPEKNIEYAAIFLRSMYDRMKSWEKAASHYHSANSELNKKYYCKVINRYQKTSKIMHNDNDEVMHYLCKNDYNIEHYSSLDEKISKRLHHLGKMIMQQNSSRYSSL